MPSATSVDMLRWVRRAQHHVQRRKPKVVPCNSYWELVLFQGGAVSRVALQRARVVPDHTCGRFTVSITPFLGMVD